MKKIRNILIFIFLTFFILGFFIKYTLLSSIKEFELRQFWKTKIYILDENKKQIIDEGIVFNAVIWTKLDVDVIIPYIFSYIKNSSDYNYWFSLFWDFDKIINIKTYLLYNNNLIFQNNVDENSIEITPQVTWDIRFWTNNQYIHSNNQSINEQNLNNIEFVIEFTWIKDWKSTNYKAINSLKKIEKEYFWNMFFYFLARNF